MSRSGFYVRSADLVFDRQMLPGLWMAGIAEANLYFPAAVRDFALPYVLLAGEDKAVTQRFAVELAQPGIRGKVYVRPIAMKPRFARKSGCAV